MSHHLQVPFLDLRRAYRAHSAEIGAAIQRVLERGWFILGEEVASLEREFAGYCGVDNGIGVASGTDALSLALRASGVGNGDEVITVANTCVPTLVAIEMTGATATFCDVSPDTLTLDPHGLEHAFSPRARAIVPVHLYGCCADMQPILEFARARNVAVVEDAAHAHGAAYRGLRAGSLGHAAAFSFYPTKNLGAFGDGGMVVSNDLSLANHVRKLRNYGQREQFRHEIRGVNSRLDEIQAALLRARLAHLDEEVTRRRAIARYYQERLDSTAIRCAQVCNPEDHAWHLFVVRVKQRDRFRNALAGAGVETMIHYPIALPLQPAYPEYKKWMSQLPVTAQAMEEIISLPLSPWMTDSEVEYVVESARKAARFSA